MNATNQPRIVQPVSKFKKKIATAFLWPNNAAMIDGIKYKMNNIIVIKNIFTPFCFVHNKYIIQKQKSK